MVAIDTDGVAAMLDDANSVIIVPGYGMAVAQAQHPLSEVPSSCAGRATPSASRSTRSPAASPAT